MSDVIEDLKLALEKSFGCSKINFLLTLNRNSPILKNSTSGWTPLHFYAKYNNAHFADEFLSEASHVKDEIDNEGATALHLAATYNSLEFIQVLLKYEPDLSIQGMFGKTAMAIAKEKDHFKVVQLLENHAACRIMTPNRMNTNICRTCEKLMIETCTCNFESKVSLLHSCIDHQSMRTDYLEEQCRLLEIEMLKQRQENEQLKEKDDYQHMYFDKQIEPPSESALVGMDFLPPATRKAFMMIHKNAQILEENINPSNVIDYMYSKGVLSTQNIQDLSGDKYNTRYKKATYLLNLTRNHPKFITGLREALLATGQRHAAELLPVL